MLSPVAGPEGVRGEGMRTCIPHQPYMTSRTHSTWRFYQSYNSTCRKTRNCQKNAVICVKRFKCFFSQGRGRNSAETALSDRFLLVLWSSCSSPHHKFLYPPLLVSNFLCFCVQCTKAVSDFCVTVNDRVRSFAECCSNRTVGSFIHT